MAAADLVGDGDVDVAAGVGWGVVGLAGDECGG